MLPIHQAAASTVDFASYQITPLPVTSASG